MWTVFYSSFSRPSAYITHNATAKPIYKSGHGEERFPVDVIDDLLLNYSYTVHVGFAEN